MSSGEYIVVELYESPVDKLKKAVWRIVGAVYNPFVTFSEIAEDPDVLGPIILVVIYLAISLLSKELYYGKVIVNFVNPKTGSIVRSSQLTFKSAEEALLFLGTTFMRMMIGWVLTTLVFWAVSNMLGGEARGKATFIAVGYLLVLGILDIALRGVNFLIVTHDMDVIKVEVPSNIDPKDLLPSITQELGKQLEGRAWPYSTIEKFIWVLFRAWLLGAGVALCNSVSRLSLKRAIIVAIVGFLAMLFSQWPA
ncbi:MAG: YIP1 family protein [Thermoprotei archaeon]|nr:YIP1 family protein [Thermoprotei archaeon]